MFFKGFSASISGKTDDNGYVRMDHEEPYAIILRNNTRMDADAEIKIDGKSVGQWRLVAGGYAKIERPVDAARKFTFLKIDSLEAYDAGLHSISKENLGLVQVIFKPEKERRHAILPQIVRTHPVFGGNDHWQKHETYCSTDVVRSAGGTGLGDHSSQEFGSTHALRTNPADWVQISLRLTLAGRYGEIHPQNMTKIPKPV